MHRLVATLFLVRTGLNFAILYSLVDLLIQLRSAGPLETLLGLALIGVLSAIILWIPILVASIVASVMMILGRPWHSLALRVVVVCGFVELWALWTGAGLLLLAPITFDIVVFAVLARANPARSERHKPSQLTVSVGTSH